MGGDDLEREGLEHEGLEHEDIERDEGLEGSEGNEMELEDPEQDSHQDALVAFIEILEVAMHTILYIRQIYPAELFDRRRLFDIPVFQCIEPSINDYVSKAIKAVGEEIIEDNVSKVIINIHKSDKPLEKFIFSFDRPKDSGSPILDPERIPLEVLQRQMRAMLLKLNTIDAQLLPLMASSNLSFSFMMELREENVHGFPEDSFDSDVSSPDVSLGKTRGKENQPEVCTTYDPALVHIIRAGAFNVSLYVQESHAKELSAQTRHGD